MSTRDEQLTRRIERVIALERSPPPRRPHAFTVWLRKQHKRQDPVGDLARDYIGDCRAEKTQFNTAELRRRVRWGGCSDAWRAFKEALGEFVRSRRHI